MKTLVIKKSSMNANDLYDYNKIQYKNEGFVPCKIEEEKENLNIKYQIDRMRSFSEIRDVSRQERIRALIDVSDKFHMCKEYMFNISPDNLYFDYNYRTFVMLRDIWARGEEPTEEEAEGQFLKEYKALIGYALQKKYSYEDYIEGGMELLQKQPFLKCIYLAQTITEVVELLNEELESIIKDIKANKLLVNKSSYRQRGICIIAGAILLLAAGAYIAYYSLWEKPLLVSKLEAENAFLREDSIQVIDALSDVDVRDLEAEQKYILSNAYITMESLTAEQKENILSKLSVDSDVKLMEYWIHIGRLNAIEAENVAMQLSDDELLLYAYMLDKDITESDTTMTGEDKATKLEELERKIEELSKSYITEEE